MGEVSAIILAAGNAERFNGVRKQMLWINNETILARICRQVSLRGVRPVVALREFSEGDESPLYPAVFTFVGNTGSSCETLLKTERHWRDRNIILLGDVIYSKPTMDAIFAETSPIRVFGNTWEIFALSFSSTLTDEVKRSLGVASRHGFGKLRYFYKNYIGVDMDEQEIEGTPLESKVFWYKNFQDYTTDVDTREEYENFLKEVLHRNRLDDCKPKVR